MEVVSSIRITLFAVIVSLTVGDSIFDLTVSCGAGCAQSTCYIGGPGCTQCIPGYCLHLSTHTAQTPSFCLPKSLCGDGYYCHSQGFCTSCGVEHCKTCSVRNQCTQCDLSYYLDDSSSYKNRCVRSYDCARGTTVRNGIQVCQ